MKAFLCLPTANLMLMVKYENINNSKNYHVLVSDQMQWRYSFLIKIEGHIDFDTLGIDWTYETNRKKQRRRQAFKLHTTLTNF